MGFRTNQCSACGGYGHNRRGCPEIKESYEKVIKVCEKYGIEPDPDRCRLMLSPDRYPDPNVIA